MRKMCWFELDVKQYTSEILLNPQSVSPQFAIRNQLPNPKSFSLPVTSFARLCSRKKIYYFAIPLLTELTWQKGERAKLIVNTQSQ